jgi:small subunit ribosomal protein S8
VVEILTQTDPLADAVTSLMNNELRNKRECLITRASKLIGSVLKVMQKNGYIGEYEFIDDGRSGKFHVQLLGRINKCGVVKPRHSVKVGELEFFEKRYLPSRDIGFLIISTPKGVISNRDAKEMNTGGKLLAYIY